MEFSSSGSSDGNSSDSSNESEVSQRRNNSFIITTVKQQDSTNHAVNASAGMRTTIKSYGEKHKSGHSTFTKDTQKPEPSSIQRTESVQSRFDVQNKPVQRLNSTNLLLQAPELPCLKSQLGLSLNEEDQFVSLAPPANLDLSFGEHSVKSTVVEHTAQFVDSRKVINDLEEQNSKLVEEKTKLSVQLGVQTKVWVFKRFYIATQRSYLLYFPDCLGSTNSTENKLSNIVSDQTIL